MRSVFIYFSINRLLIQNPLPVDPYYKEYFQHISEASFQPSK